MLLTKEVEVGLCSKTIQYYEDKGYEIPKYIGRQGKYKVKAGTKIMVSVNDLPIGSSKQVEYLCDYCLEEGIETILSTPWHVYNKHKKDIVNKDVCNKHKFVKNRESGLYESKITPEILIDLFQKLVEEIGYIPKQYELDKINIFPSHKYIYDYFNNYHNFVEMCGYNSNRDYGTKYKEDFLIDEIKRFVKEFNKIPIQIDFENLNGYPSRKTFSNHFKDFNEVVRLAGFEPANLSQKEYAEKYKNKEYLSKIIYNYIDKYDNIPTLDELIKEYNNFHSLKSLYEKVYGGWNKALIELGLPLNQSHHTDEFLESEFHRFVKINGRIPTYAEFNASEYPSFWCYQNRFGSWNKAVVNYGYEPNDENRKYTLDDGEICASSYEFDISTWLKNINIIYDRDVNYIDFIDNYKGKMNCDYVIHHNNELWYVEMAGFLRGTDFNKYSDAEKKYFFKLKYKRKLLRRQGVNYLIIEPCDLKKKSLEEIFFFLFFKDEEKVG